MVKTCTKCAQDKATTEFAVDRSKNDGRDSWCRACRNEARKARYYARLAHEQQRSRNYYRTLTDDERQAKVDRAKEWAQANPERTRQHWHDRYRRMDPAAREALRQKGRARYMNRHGGVDEWARMYQEQDGLCYLCLQPLPDDRSGVAVDHDHDCCPVGPGGRILRSCRYCRRGLTHQACNQIWGLARENPAMLRVMAGQGGRIRDETRRRIAAKPAAQPELLDAKAS